ncbi:MAG: methyltransferase domain-containing protein [Chloroflexi bacterium]|nr:methyltransferase domain-containing protein [Chloroflexota bacterium]
MERDCPVCGSAQKQLIYTQKFSQISEGSLFGGYDVVVCYGCGFGFADNIPAQGEFDRYYQQMSKYENEHQGGQISPSAQETYDSIVRQVKPFLADENARIIDVGCATGGLLAAFQKNGYGDILGVDPSPSCSKTAQRLYGIRVENTPVSEIPRYESLFDLVILNSVLEHIRDLDDSLAALRNLLKPGGLLWIEVPDVSRFTELTSAAFQQFSMEHINFFSSTSLTNLLHKNGFETAAVWHNTRRLEEIQDPALSTLFRRSDGVAVNREYDHETKRSLLEYLDSSYQADSGVLRIIDEVVESRRSIIVWGTGTHTQRLLATSRLRQADIKAFIDSNPNYQGKNFSGVPVLSPDALAGMSEPVLISSRLYQNEIADEIRTKRKLPNEIILLYQSWENQP